MSSCSNLSNNNRALPPSYVDFVHRASVQLRRFIPSVGNFGQVSCYGAGHEFDALQYAAKEHVHGSMGQKYRLRKQQKQNT
jgi:hypothetical protein